MTSSDQQHTGNLQSRGGFRLAAVCLVLGIAAILPSGYGLFLSLPAIIVGHFARYRVKRAPGRYSGGGMALAGLILGYFSIPTALVVAAIFAAQEMARSSKCMSNMKEVSLAARVLALDRQDQKLPTNWVSMQKELTNFTVLVCPLDKRRKPATNWANFSPQNVSYEMVTLGTGLDDLDTETNVFFRCLVHGHEAMTDGSIVYGSPPNKADSVIGK